MQNAIIARLIGFFLNKKKIIGWIAPFVLAAGAVAAGMSNQDFRDAVCGAPVLEQGAADGK